MRLFLSDSFFDKFAELPRNVQKRVRDFQSKFRTNSQSSAIHLEPVVGSKDSNLRSARVDQAYRAILGDLGQDNYTLLWVDKHDDAYRWAQNKRFAWNDHIQSVQIIPIADSITDEAPKPDAAESKVSVIDNITDEQLLQIGVPDELLPLVRTIKDIDDLDKAEQHLPQDVFENIFSLLDGERIEDIIADVEDGLAKDGEDALLSNNNKRRFIEITDDEVLANIMEQGMEKWQLFLHPSQRRLVDSSYRGTVKVSGSAGTGKTIAALHRLKTLTQNQNVNVLFTTYTTALSDYLRELVCKMDLSTKC